MGEFQVGYAAAIASAAGLFLAAAGLAVWTVIRLRGRGPHV
jgi:hypothetical protein